MERKLKNRRKRANKGRVIRVSTLVYETLDKQRLKKSWDWLFRRLCGLPNRAGDSQTLVEGMLETMTGKFFLKVPGLSWGQLEEDAYEVAIIAAAKRKTKNVSRPLRMRELP